ncbi:hypothetical protein [Clostridium saccharobutylicum]|uniref:ABC-2 family transporter protein n=1 Tax=Clostridium saccharobutylicum DSM 13864 TaxID=1345695 RepID=U5MUX6_CLOSA|nr:hypothetical protein [Clostridium saccharobutylicum]AGX44348.1 hypothetical protein CLSA_c33850 [Clostridium saccharobutylicum DSM 13864]AQR91641.1 hypothetical protein CLOSC_33670 [Clostridium saccharobutylicum]AQS01546.1 hypothetical protein CSACC_33750 [Clostridium saccharobutylicum]AQS15529.1 hypothetical protein CLOSACC_33750 [Clostridium saccharobutylicum]MBA2906938.1 ABC-2 type transport system permease protein [Clostridium saccharobutylicum]
MRKYLNKGLLYEWFNASKVPIVIGLITWGFIAHMILKDNIRDICQAIGTAESNNYEVNNLDAYVILVFIFLAIYIFANGANKRNTMMFLCSGPYTKKQIKVNELICLLMTLGLFVIMYIYMAVTMYVQNYEFISIVNGYTQVIFIEILRLLLFGTIGILLLIEIDLLFSNSIIAYFGMIALLLSTMVIWLKLRIIMSYLHILTPIMNAIFRYPVRRYNDHANMLFYGRPYYSGEWAKTFKGIAVLIVIIAIMLVIFNIFEKKYKLEASSKIFSCKANENMIVTYISLAIGSFADLLIVDEVLSNRLFRNARMQPYVSFESFEMLATDLIIIGVVTFISYKIIKKILKAIG